MSGFTERHDEQLYDFFAGVYDGRCGLRSHLGGLLEALKNGTRETGPRSPDCMPVKPQDRNAHRDFDLTEDMMDSARKSRQIEKTLRTMETLDVRVLAAHYGPRPTGLDRNPVLDAVLGADEARDVVVRSRSEDRDVRREGKKALASAEYRARVALETAQEAYASACEQMAELEREKRHGRFLGALHGT
jgi:hypothetical protein